MDKETEIEKTDNLIKDDSNKPIESGKKSSVSYKKNLQAISPKYNKAIEQETQSIRMMNMSDRLALVKPKVMLSNEQIINTVNSNLYKTKIQAIMPSYNSVFEPIKQSLAVNNISTAMGEIAKQQLTLCNENIIKAMTSSLSNALSQIAETQRIFINTITESISNSIAPIFKDLSASLEEARNNPDSLLSWMNYYDKLSEFFWIMPYKITTEELHEILQNVATEKEFDQYINRYFNKTKVDSLIDDIKGMLSNNNQRKIFDQIVIAYKNKSYALASIGITTMIDNSLSYYLIDKGCTSRIKLFEPIINDLELKRDDSDFSFIVMMVNSNINLLYEQVEFNDKISINTNKKSRRNPISHGKAYSNKRIDTIMLMNTMYYLLAIQNELKSYKNRLYRNSKKKEFYIPNSEERRKIKEKIKNKKYNTNNENKLIV